MSVTGILYQFFLYGVPLAVAGALFGLRWKEGLWGNLLGIFAVMFSILVAISWWEPCASLISENVPAMLFISDYIAVWVLFLFPLAVISEMTRALSRVKVKFPETIEKVGNGLALTAMVALLLSFFSFSMDLSPVGENADATAPVSDPIFYKALRQLTGGNLASFVEPRKFDARGQLQTDHFHRRQELMKYAIEKQSLLFEGSVPPVKK